MCRLFGAVKDHTARPTVSTVGYVVTSLRDFEQYKSRAPYINSGRNFLRDKLLGRISHESGKDRSSMQQKQSGSVVLHRSKDSSGAGHLLLFMYPASNGLPGWRGIRLPPYGRAPHPSTSECGAK